MNMIYLDKISQKSYVLITMLIFMLINSGCVKENIAPPSRGRDAIIDLSIGSASMTTTDSNVLFDAENNIRAIRIFTFNGDVLENNQYSVREVIVGDGGFTGSNGVYNIKMVVKEHNDKDFYVMMNEPVALRATLDAVKSAAELDLALYTLADYFTNKNIENSAFCFNGAAPVSTFEDIPMFGKSLNKSVISSDGGDRKSVV